MSRRHFRQWRLVVLGFLGVRSQRRLSRFGLCARGRCALAGRRAVLRQRLCRLIFLAAEDGLASGLWPLCGADIDQLHAVSQLLGDVLVNRTGMGLFVFETHLVQDVQQDSGFDL